MQLTVTPQIQLSGVQCFAEEGAIHIRLGKILPVSLLLVKPNGGELGDGAVATQGLVSK